jgi:carbamoyl-phosphate synthase small subunit
MNYEEKWQAERERAGFLALADGAVFRGVAFGAREDRLGEAVFNTGMSGYQEIATDPSYAGQIVALTTAEVGNYGTNPDDAESRGLFLSGLVVNDLAEPSNYRSTLPLDRLLADAGVPGLRGLDTRSLTLHLRDHGSQRAYLHVSDEPLDTAEAVRRAREWEGLDGQDYAAKVSCKTAYDFPPAESAENAETSSFAAKRHSSFAPQAHPSFAAERHPSFAPEAHPSFTSGPLPLVAVYDFGVKRNILRSIASFARVRVVPAKTPAEEVLALKPAGVFLSNGPADPAALPYAIENIRKILGRCPVMGICLGHQLLALACGAKTGRLAFGHHGCNHPVKELATGRVQITSQNHNFAVLADTLPPELEVTHVNLNDGTIEGLRHRTLPAFSVQYHPEACPGPHDAAPLFDRFRTLLTA